MYIYLLHSNTISVCYTCCMYFPITSNTCLRHPLKSIYKKHQRYLSIRNFFFYYISDLDICPYQPSKQCVNKGVLEKVYIHLGKTLVQALMCLECVTYRRRFQHTISSKTPVILPKNEFLILNIVSTKSVFV